MIPLMSPLVQNKAHKLELLSAINEVIEAGNYVLGSSVTTFEQEFSEYCNVPFAIGVNSGTDALTLALIALGVGGGDEVITVSHTALATVAGILASGATPVCVDLELDTYTISPQGLSAAISEKTKAIVVVHLYGQMADMDAILRIAREHDIHVVEDCAQSTGASYRGSKAGSLGIVGCFSFYPTKNLGAIGDGGMVVTRDENIAERVRRIRQYGWGGDRKTEYPGLNSRLDEMQAAILIKKLPKLDNWNTRRSEIAKKYRLALKSCPIILPAERSDTVHVYHLFVIRTEKRNALKNFLLENGVMTGVHYPEPAHYHGGYSQLIRVGGLQLGLTEKIVDEILSLPMYPELSDENIHRVTTLIQNFFSRI